MPYVGFLPLLFITHTTKGKNWEKKSPSLKTGKNKKQEGGCLYISHMSAHQDFEFPAMSKNTIFPSPRKNSVKLIEFFPFSPVFFCEAEQQGKVIAMKLKEGIDGGAGGNLRNQSCL